MQILHKQSGTKGMFYVSEDEDILAEISYTLPSTHKMIIEHTEVDEALRGQNVGYQLVNHAVEYARQHQMKIIPLCPFTNSVFHKRADYADVWEK